jgi:hypothetical protein
MADGYTEVRGRPVGGQGQWLLWLVWLAVLGTGGTAIALAWMGWSQVLKPDTPEEYGEVAIRSIKVLLLSDIYYDKDLTHPLDPHKLFGIARALGIVASLIVGGRLIVLALGSRFFGFFFRRTTGKHHVVVGDGPAAQEYSSVHNTMFRKGRAIHLSARRLPIADRLATFERRGPLRSQLHYVAAQRATRIVVDEGDDADTWQTAQAAARLYPDTQVLAHITDPWIRDQLSRERLGSRLVPFSFAGGAARQVLLAHPPYLLANALGETRQHILIVGFGQVGQALLREFIVTCVLPDQGQLMITIVDPRAEAVRKDFESRHPHLVKMVDIAFVPGDFRQNELPLLNSIRDRSKIAGICAAYVAIDQVRHPLDMAFALRSMALREKLFQAPIFICAQHGAGLAPVKAGSGNIINNPEVMEERHKQAMAEGILCNLRVVSFGAWPAAFDGAGMLEPEFDEQARRYHTEYERFRIEQERRVKGSILHDVTAWRDLPDGLRVSNRRAAAHMRAKAFVAGYDLETWLAGGKCPDTHELPAAMDKMRTDDPAFVHRMAILEHTRWMLDRFLDGWAPGPHSNFNRTRTTFVPFEDLPDEDKEKDTVVIETARVLMKEWNTGKKRKKR